MARSVLYDRLRWLLYKRPPGVVIGYLERTPGVQGSRIVEIPLERVASADRWALTLDDGWTAIPLHRIMYIRSTRDEKVFYEKKNREGEGEA